MGSIGAWALFTVSVGVMTGQVQPFGNGFNKTYQREAHPKRFWASLVWNAFFSCLCLWLAYQLNDDASKKPLQDKCYDEDGVYLPQEQLTACNKLIGGPGSSNDADAYLDRGLVFLDIGKFDEALADFTRAHELDPKDPWPLANRGIAFAWLGAYPTFVPENGSGKASRSFSFFLTILSLTISTRVTGASPKGEAAPTLARS